MKLKLCKKSCCPTVEFVSANEIIVRDDFGGKVVLDSSHIQDLYKKYVLWESGYFWNSVKDLKSDNNIKKDHTEKNIEVPTHITGMKRDI